MVEFRELGCQVKKGLFKVINIGEAARFIEKHESYRDLKVM